MANAILIKYSRMLLSYPVIIIIISPVNNEPVYLLNVPNRGLIYFLKNALKFLLEVSLEIIFQLCAYFRLILSIKKPC